jgi:hypothetical protein
LVPQSETGKITASAFPVVAGCHPTMRTVNLQMRKSFTSQHLPPQMELYAIDGIAGREHFRGIRYACTSGKYSSEA